jgi:pimeloyl-ACP methyl ester carboxylesterase
MVGHSMGAMFSIRAASGAADPGLFTRLVLVAPPGLVPILGEMAAFLGLKIRLNFPECVFQYLGCVLCPVVNFWQTWRGSGDLALFRFQRYSDRAAFGSGLVRRLNRFSWTGYSTWHVTSMAELFRLRVPVLLVYGERDLLVPADQGELLVRMAQNKLPCAVVRGAGHGVFLSDPDKVAGLLLRDGDEGEGVPPDSRTVFDEVARIVEPIDALRYRVSLSRGHARCVIRKLYWGLLEATGASQRADSIVWV